MSHKKHVASREEIEVWLINKLAKNLGINKNKIDIDQNFTEYGLGSIEAVSITGDLEKWLAKPILPTLLWDYSTIRKLAHHLAINDQSISEASASATTKQQKMVDNTKEYKKYSQIQHFPEVKMLNNLVKNVEKDAGESLYFRVNTGIARNITQIDGKNYINFSSYNYLNMSGDKAVEKAAIDAIKQYGTSVSGSRIAGGQKPLHLELEHEICDLIGAEDCLVFNSGHATNVSTIGHMIKKKDLILYDKLAHNSIIQGILLSGATAIAFPHNDLNALTDLLQKKRSQYERVLIITEGVYSMDGDIPDVPRIIKLKKQYHALLYIDEAHSIGVLGKQGAGIRDYFHLNPNDVDFWMGTLSKSLASCGGYIAGRKKLIDYLRYSVPSFVYSCGLSPADTAASIAALQLLKVQPERVANLQDRSNLMLALLKQANINTGTSFNTPVIPIIIGDSTRTIQLCIALRREGLFTQALFYPAVEEGASRLRLFINSSHTEQQLRASVLIIINNMQRLKLI